MSHAGRDAPREGTITTNTSIPAKGAIVSRDLETFGIHPHIPGGFASPALLRRIADVAGKYGAQYAKLTAAQRVILIGVREEDLDAAWAEFEDTQKAVGLTVRSIQVCPGTRACKRAPGQPRARARPRRTVLRCARPGQVQDGRLGLLGLLAQGPGVLRRPDGFTAVVGGKGAGTARAGRGLATGLPAGQALELAGRVIEFYRANGEAPERPGGTIDRSGSTRSRRRSRTPAAARVFVPPSFQRTDIPPAPNHWYCNHTAGSAGRRREPRDGEGPCGRRRR